MKEYIKVSGRSDVNNLRIDFDYDLGGMNYFTGRVERRGYYISIMPVYRTVREGGWTSESYTAFTGVKTCLLEVARKSSKKEQEAQKLFEAEKQKYIDYMLKRYNLTVEV